MITENRLDKQGLRVLSLQLYNNNNHANVYGSIFMTKVIARVHPVHLMNVD